METSLAGLAALEAREGKRLIAYEDTQGVWTIGVGHAATGLPPHPYKGMRITQEECDALLRADLDPVEKAINGLGAKLTQNQFDACASLAFNIGTHAFLTSTVVRKINVGDMAGAADAFLLWTKPAVLKGRRELERRQFLTPDNKPVPSSVSAPAKVAAKPAPAPAAAAPAPLIAATKASPMDASTLLNIGSLLVSGFTTAESYISAAPTLVSHIPDAASKVKTAVTDGGTVMNDLKAGKYGQAAQVDAPRFFADLGAIFQAAAPVMEAVVGIVSKAPTLPSTAGLAAIGKPITKAGKSA